MAKVKQSIGEGGEENDELLTELVARGSDEVVAFLRVPRAADNAEPTLGRETYVETIKYVYGEHDLYLSRRPIASITSVVEDGVTLTSGTDFQANNAAGVLERLDGDDIDRWRADKIVVTYAAGWLLPTEQGRNLPPDIEEATIYAVLGLLSDYGSDLASLRVRSESLDGVYSISYQTDGASATAVTRSGSLPDRAVALLSKYRNVMV